MAGLPKSLTQTLRQGQLTVGSGWRAYFAPFNSQTAVSTGSSTLGPTLYDLQAQGKFFDASANLSGWFDLGYVKNVKMTPGSKIGSVVAGYRGVARAKYRAEVQESCSVELMEASRMAWKIASGTQVFNLLHSTEANPMGPLSSSGSMPGVPMGASGYLPTGAVTGPTQGKPTLYVPSGSGSMFTPGSYIVADIDYDGIDYGFVGAAGANLFENASTDVEFIRKTSDFVSGVLDVVPGDAGEEDALILTGPFVGGGNSPAGKVGNTSPSPSSKVQTVIGFATREGGTFMQEWSALFILDTIDASQVLVYYPRLSPQQFSGWTEENLQNATSMQTRGLAASFEGMAYEDPLDGETVVRYMAYYPHPRINIQI